MNELNKEVSAKLELIRNALTETEAQGVRFKGTDWFAWATAGASNTVLLTAETGVAEVLVTLENAWILTDEIEAQRLKDEEIPENFQFQINPWADAEARESFVREATNGGKVLCDRPIPHIEKRLPPSLQNHKRVLMSSELERYREIGRKASEAMTEVLASGRRCRSIVGKRFASSINFSRWRKTFTPLPSRHTQRRTNWTPRDDGILRQGIWFVRKSYPIRLFWYYGR